MTYIIDNYSDVIFKIRDRFIWELFEFKVTKLD